MFMDTLFKTHGLPMKIERNGEIIGEHDRIAKP